MTRNYLPSFDKILNFFPLSILSLVLIYIWTGSPFPFQDYPQHLAIAKVIRDYAQNPLYQEYYMLSTGFVNYHSMHHLLAMLGTLVNLELAFNILLSMYALVLFFAFRYFTSTQFPNETAENKVRLSFFSIVFFSPPLMMGFIPYILGIPFMIVGIGLCFDIATNGIKSFKEKFLKISGIIGSIIACGFFHGFTLISLIIVSFCYYLATRKKDFVILSCAAFAYFLSLSSLMGLGLHKQSIWELESEYKFNYPGLQVFQELFQIRWYGSLASLNHFIWSFLESHPTFLLLPLTILALVSIYFLNKLASQKFGISSSNPGFKASLYLIAISFLCPWAVGWPTDFTFIDLRLFAIAAFLVYASFPSKLLKNRQQQKIIIAFLLLNTIFSYYGKARFKMKADAALELIDTIPDNKVLVSVITDHYSPYVAAYTGVYHFLPMFYTLRKEGVNTQFWANLTAHIPVKYKKNKSFSVPDWRTWQLKKSHLASGDFLLANQPFEENKVTTKIRETYIPLTKKVSCIKQWCLYKLNSQDVLDEIF
ncbi:MAG: hypothetical protein AB8G05_17425 [Oligoflexales bacterium]